MVLYSSLCSFLSLTSPAPWSLALRESYLSCSFPCILPHAPCLPSHDCGIVNGSCWCPEKKQLQVKFDQLLAVGIIGYVEVGGRNEKRLVDCSAVILSS